MTLRVRGPRAREFVALLGRYSGLPLMLAGQEVQADQQGLIDPFESEVLRRLVGEVMRSPNEVAIVAFGRAAPGGFNGDLFSPPPGMQLPRRSVIVPDLLDVEARSPVLARAFMGHILREYLGAARPPGQAPGRAFAVYHVPAIRTEAEIASELTGLPIYPPPARPWETWTGTTMTRCYGPNLRYRLTLGPGGNLVSVTGPGPRAGARVGAAAPAL
jgi:hypothetical protein